MPKTHGPTHVYKCHGKSGTSCDIKGTLDESAASIKLRAQEILQCPVSYVDNPVLIVPKKKRTPRLTKDDIDKIEVESNVPIPTKETNPSRWEDLIKRMKIGDSIKLLAGDGTAFRTAAKKHGFVIVIRADKEEGKVRCWKTVKKQEAPVATPETANA